MILRTRVSEGAKAGDIGRKGQLLYFIAWEGYSLHVGAGEQCGQGAHRGVPG